MSFLELNVVCRSWASKSNPTERSDNENAFPTCKKNIPLSFVKEQLKSSKFWLSQKINKNGLRLQQRRNPTSQRLEHFIGVVGLSFSESFTNSISHMGLFTPKDLTRFSHGSASIATTTVCSSAAKTDSTVSDVVEYQDVQDHTNGVSPNHTSAGDFSKEGNPIEFPESVVPEAYREWEVWVFDWQTQCPTLAQPEEPVLVYKLIKLLPAVACEADAATR